MYILGENLNERQEEQKQPSKNKNKNISEQNQVSEEARQFLTEQGFSSLKSLEKKIADLEADVALHEARGTVYTFPKLNVSLVNDALNFLNKCKSFKILKDKPIKLISELEVYVQHYKEYIVIEINYLFDEIQNQSSNANLKAQLLKSRVQELNDFEKYPSIGNLINTREITQDFIEKLENYLLILVDELSIDATHNLNLNEKLEKLKAFCLLDSLVNGKFFELYRSYQNTQVKQIKENYDRIIQSIEKNDYVNALNELAQINELEHNKQAFNQLKHVLKSSLIELNNKSLTLTLILGNSLDESGFQNVSDNLFKLKQALNYLNIESNAEIREKFKLNALIDQETQERLNNGIKEIEDNVYEKLLDRIENIKDLISMTDFYEAELKRESLRKICIITKIERIEEINNRAGNMKRELEGLVGNISNHYKEKSLRDFILYPPKTLIDKLTKVASTNPAYNQSLCDLKSNILKKYEEILNEAKSDFSDEREEKLQLVESTLGSLPQEIRDIIELKLNSLKSFFQSTEARYQDDLTSLVNLGDMNALKLFIEKCSNKGMNMLTREIFNKIKDMFNGYKKNLIDCLDETLVKNSLDKLRKLIELKQLFGGLINELESSYCDIEKKIIDLFVQNRLALEKIADNELDREQIQVLGENFYLFVEFKNNYEKNNSLRLVKHIKIQSSKVYNALYDYFQNNQLEFSSSLDKLNMERLRELLSQLKFQDNLLAKTKKLKK